MSSSRINRRGFLAAGSAGLFVLKPVLLVAQQTELPSPAAKTSAEEQRFETRYGDFLLRDLRFSAPDLKVQGALTNQTDRRWRWVSFLLRMADAAGNPIPHDDGFDGHFYVKDIGKGETRNITDVHGEPARLLLRPRKQPASVSAELQPERSYFDSKYVFALGNANENDKLGYQDESIKIRFHPTSAGLSFALTNRSRQAVRIDWEQLIYVDLSGYKRRVIHQGVPLGEKDKKQAPTTIQPGASLDDRLYPADLVAGSRIFEDWRLNPFLPLTQYAPRHKWRSSSVLLPLEFAGSQVTAYHFSIRIEDVVV